ncbi:MAG: tetratricopeptide repeat protein [Planctomycetota bacterium]|nr:tetratricopeptide repeat protein [Planctomycetota bacterium]MDA1213390.1 tetratricopeptide repeat protein [Planctomycetota bacterium]
MSSFSHRQVMESRSLAQQARSAEQSGNHRQAEHMLLEAIQKNPDDGDLRLQLAKSYLSNGEKELGIAALQSAAEDLPENHHIYKLWAQTLIDDGRYDEALVPLQLGLNQDPTFIELWMLKGSCEVQTERYQQAFDSYQRVVQIAPDHSSARLRMAQIQIQWGRPSLAAPLLRAALQDSNLSDDRRSEAWWLLGVVYGQEKRWHDAVLALKKGLQDADETNLEKTYRLAYAEFQAGDYDAAGREADKVLASDPDHQSAKLLKQVLLMNDPDSTASEDTIIQATFSSDLVPPHGW